MANSRAANLATAALIAGSATTFVGAWEGERNYPYLDVGGKPTVCKGHTANVEQRYYSPEECDRLLAMDLAAHTTVMLRMVDVQLSQGEMIAYSSLTFNVGVAAFQDSTLREMLNAENRMGACKQILRYAKAKINGTLRLVKGLINRRAAEYHLCIQPDRQLATR